jgi:hypothetical protein
MTSAGANKAVNPGWTMVNGEGREGRGIGPPEGLEPGFFVARRSSATGIDGERFTGVWPTEQLGWRSSGAAFAVGCGKRMPIEKGAKLPTVGAGGWLDGHVVGEASCRVCRYRSRLPGAWGNIS